MPRMHAQLVTSCQLFCTLVFQPISLLPGFHLRSHLARTPNTLVRSKVALRMSLRNVVLVHAGFRVVFHLSCLRFVYPATSADRLSVGSRACPPSSRPQGPTANPLPRRRHRDGPAGRAERVQRWRRQAPRDGALQRVPLSRHHAAGHQEPTGSALRNTNAPQLQTMNRWCESQILALCGGRRARAAVQRDGLRDARAARAVLPAGRHRR